MSRFGGPLDFDTSLKIHKLLLAHSVPPREATYHYLFSMVKDLATLQNLEAEFKQRPEFSKVVTARFATTLIRAAAVNCRSDIEAKRIALEYRQLFAARSDFAAVKTIDAAANSFGTETSKATLIHLYAAGKYEEFISVFQQRRWDSDDVTQNAKLSILTRAVMAASKLERSSLALQIVNEIRSMGPLVCPRKTSIS